MSEQIHRSKHQKKKERRLQKVTLLHYNYKCIKVENKGKRSSHNVKGSVQPVTKEERNKATSKVTDNEYIV